MNCVVEYPSSIVVNINDESTKPIFKIPVIKDVLSKDLKIEITQFKGAKKKKTSCVYYNLDISDLIYILL